MNSELLGSGMTANSDNTAVPSSYREWMRSLFHQCDIVLLTVWADDSGRGMSGESMRQAVETGSIPSQHTVLVVDDDPEPRMTAAYLFEDFGFRVLEAGDGAEALEVLERQPKVDLLFTDCRMPRLSGPDLARTASLKWPDLRIVLVTGNQDRLMPEWPTIWKPYTFRTIERVVERILAPG